MSSEYDDFEDELVGSTTQQKNWRGILIALLVIVSVLGLIVTAIVLMTPKEVNEEIGEKLTFYDYMHHNFDPVDFRPIWSSDDVLFYRNTEGAVVQYSYSDNSTSTVMLNSTFRELDTDIYKISADGKYALLPYNMQKINRHSFIAKYRILEIETQLHTELCGPIINGKELGSEFQYATWTPNNHSLLVVFQYNIYYLDSWKSLKDIDGTLYQPVTIDGVESTIYNGIPDWLYEEEILHTNHALWPGPDGTGVTYARFDDTDVHRYNMTLYGVDSKYVGNKRLPYPRPNTTNPTITLKHYNLITKETTTLMVPSELSEYYFLSLVWIDRTQVIIIWLSRQHNVSVASVCNIESGNCTYSYRTEADTGWLDMTQPPVFTTDKQAYFIISSKSDNVFGSYKHIQKIYMRSNEQGIRLFITSGKMEVQKILAFQEENNLLYFLANNPYDPRERHLYRTTTDQDHEDFMNPTCLTCEKSDQCLYVDATFNRLGQSYVLSCLGPGVPYHHLMASPFTLVQVLEDNAALRETLTGKALPKLEYVKIPTEDGNYMWSKMLLPVTLKKDEIIEHNLILHMNGAPGTQMVTHQFAIDWDQYLVSQHEFIVAYVDVKGTGGRGDEWLYAVHKKLGTVEVADTLTAAKYFRRHSYVHDKMAILGKAHGGFLTTSMLGNRDNIFRCGIAISPVTDWRYYDSFYAEKYMGFPIEADNLQNYNKANVSQYANYFRKSRFMLLHGTADETVHFQNSAQLIKALTEKDVYFKTQIYTDQDHFLNGGNTRNHLYNTLEDFLYQCFDKVHPRDEEPIVIEEDE